MRILWCACLLVPGCCCAHAQAGQQSAEIARVAGVDDASGITWVLLSMNGRRVDSAQSPAPPRLTAQCTRNAAGKLKFELLADTGSAAPLTFVPPWKPAKDDLYPPALLSVSLTMEFLGYTRVKPVKRQWSRQPEPSPELVYNSPGMRSANMEEVTFYLRYLRSLPTLRLTFPAGPVLEFETIKWQSAVREEPLCRASGL